MPSSYEVGEPYFVTPHALKRARERCPALAALPDRELIYEVQRGLQGQAPYPPHDRPIAIGDSERRFVAVVQTAPRDGDWPAVVTLWRWGQFPLLLRQKPHRGGRKYYRWLRPRDVAHLG